ncbi:unnamed protein product [Adineta steineri]|uniref:Uncharacterized protein n=1 Tax=Adineta steineri TaxID=433720 RepID=A0A815XB85_9BILA|nr:unnamed protein product [Adineta steineri]CAF1555338.1 unnamed protein product [Adineta steineri]
MYPGELKEQEIREFQIISNVTVRVLIHNVTVASTKHSPFAIKVGAIIQSSFEHVLWLDSDNIAVRDPEYLFDLSHYTHSTAIFWPDFWTAPKKNAIWKILGIPCRAEDYEQEAGQILINKRLSWRAVNLALYFMSDEIFLKVAHGDKDAFRFSWKVLSSPFYFVRKFVAQAGYDYVKSIDKFNSTKTIKFCGHTMVQHDPVGEILFLHANLIKTYPLISFPSEKIHQPLKKYENPWRIYRRYANSAPYLRSLGFIEDGVWCMRSITDNVLYLPPLVEDDFHNHVSPNITAQYLLYLNGSIINSREYGVIDVLDRNWQEVQKAV